MIAPNTILRDRYRIIQKLGHGGMGAVYQAMDENLNCLVAVKETFAENDEQRRAFRREAQLLANLRHSTLPKVMDHFTEGEGQFLVMEFVPGHDLNELLKLREQPFPVAKVLDWADQVLDALEKLHSFNPPILHLDIKPANLKVTPEDSVLLLDFGLAKGAAGQMSTVDDKSRGISGYSPNYSPIEQFLGAGTDPRSDLYALAATLWTLLTAQAPPDARSRLAEKEEGNPDPLRQARALNSQVPTAVSAALDRALAINRNLRYANAAELRGVLIKARDAKFESPTRPIVDGPAAEAPAVPLPKATVEAPYPEPSQPASAASPSAKSSEQQRVKAATGEPTMRVKPLPSEPTRESEVLQTATPLPIDGGMAGASRKRVAMIVAAVAVFGIVTVGLAVWRPWSSAANLNSTNLDAGVANPLKKKSEMARTHKDQMGIEFVLIPPGRFMMGSNNHGDEKPVHQVTISYSFYMGKYEVTQAQWQAVMGNNPSGFKDCANCPVEQVSWDDTQKFIQRLNEMNDGYTYRLPTEAEWEYACRAGTTTAFAFGDSLSSDLSNFDGNNPYGGAAKGVYRKKTTPVGSFRPNDWGLLDMHGNVAEWCQDWYHATYFGAPTDGSAWLSGGEMKYRVQRGGAWDDGAIFLLSAYRNSDIQEFRLDDRVVGFRVVAVR